MNGMTHIQLRELFNFAQRDGKIEYQVYSTNIDDTYGPYGPYWEWIPLTVGVIETVKAKQIIVSNFRTTVSTYNTIKEPRPKPVVLYPARKTGKRYNHVKPIDLYKKNNNFNARIGKKYPSC